MKRVLITIMALFSVGLILGAVSIASADTLRLFSLTGNASTLDGYTTDGVTFRQTLGESGFSLVSGGYLSIKASSTSPIQIVAERDGQPLNITQGTLILGDAARVTSAGPGCTFSFGLGDSAQLTQAGLYYGGEFIAKQNFYDNAWVIRFSPIETTIAQNGLDVVTLSRNLSGQPSQFNIYCAGASNSLGSVGTFHNMTLYTEDSSIPAPAPSPEPTPSPEPAPMPAPQPSPTPTDDQLADALKRLEKVEQVVTYQNGLLAQAQEAIRNNTDGGQTLLLELDRLAAEKKAHEEAQALKDAAQDEEMGFLRGVLNHIQTFIANIDINPFNNSSYLENGIPTLTPMDYQFEQPILSPPLAIPSQDSPKPMTPQELDALLLALVRQININSTDIYELNQRRHLHETALNDLQDSVGWILGFFQSVPRSIPKFTPWTPDQKIT